MSCDKYFYKRLHTTSSTDAGMALARKLACIISVQVQDVKEVVEEIENDVTVANINNDRGNARVGGYTLQETKDGMTRKKKTV